VEFCILPQLEGARHAVGRHLPAFREFWRQLFAVIGRRAVRQRLRRIAQQPIVAVPRQAVDGLVRADTLHVERVRAELLDDQQRFGARLRQRKRHVGGGKASDAEASEQKLAAAEWEL
jgi:hypothetical protein